MLYASEHPFTAADPQGGEGGDRPLDWGQKNFIARPKNTHICKPTFACQNVLKLTYSNLEFQDFPGEDPRTPSSRGGEGRGREGGEGWEREGKEGGEG